MIEEVKKKRYKLQKEKIKIKNVFAFLPDHAPLLLLLVCLLPLPLLVFEPDLELLPAVLLLLHLPLVLPLLPLPDPDLLSLLLPLLDFERDPDFDAELPDPDFEPETDLLPLWLALLLPLLSLLLASSLLYHVATGRGVGRAKIQNKNIPTIIKLRSQKKKNTQRVGYGPCHEFRFLDAQRESPTSIHHVYFMQAQNKYHY